MGESNVNVDLMGPGGGQGTLAQMAASGQLNIGRMRPFIGNDGVPRITVYEGGPPDKASSWKTMQANAGTLRREEWQALDESLLGIAEARLGGVQGLISRGLVFRLGNAMGTTVLEYHDVSDAFEAQLSMDAVSRGQGDRPEFKSVFLPIPIIHVDYEINTRVLEASRKLGNPLDTTSAERAARKVLEKQEKMFFTDQNYSFGGGTIYSFVNFPHRIYPGGGSGQNIANISDWSSSTVAGEDIVDEVLEMKQKSIDNLHYGPWIMYVAPNFETKLDQDYSDAKGSNTIRERILQINNINAIEVVDYLPAGNVLLVQLTTDVIRVVEGLGLQNIQWQTEGGFVNKFKVISIRVPQIRADQNGRTGIIHSYPTVAT